MQTQHFSTKSTVRNSSSESCADHQQWHQRKTKSKLLFNQFKSYLVFVCSLLLDQAHTWVDTSCLQITVTVTASVWAADQQTALRINCWPASAASPSVTPVNLLTNGTVELWELTTSIFTRALDSSGATFSLPHYLHLFILLLHHLHVPLYYIIRSLCADALMLKQHFKVCMLFTVLHEFYLSQ